ncbi:nicotinate-nucleotide-dimethylbenzimidazole phosphoribosyltransferase [Nitzschia inconspicua]|uniref:Nicotinate-nucleotide-dimethylbenzimidazole phosphoribosyltransferase n=1 Tax=Nitzschia inconspicua TaxID=303405 RepID=A0A9K3L8B0_9STRA|nr:nicotinate-nucleotide-dimethylbenzimidazole phosphoribosyltransferase [Nitzschia inconspicua]
MASLSSQRSGDCDGSSISSTTVLDRGTVESRGFGGGLGQTKDDIAAEIETFLEENYLSLRTETRCFWSIFIFVTTLPGPAWVECHPGFLMKGMCYFPVVGSIIGILVAIVFDFGRDVIELPSVVAAALCTAASFRWTGCLHEDGLADSADGIGGGWTRQQILRIMTDTRLGTFGSAALILCVITKLEILAALNNSEWRTYHSEGAGPALVVCHAMSRLTAPYLINQNVYVEEDGPKSHFYSFMIRAKFLVSGPRVLFSVLFCYGVARNFYGSAVSLYLIVITWVCAEFAGYYGRYKLGGVMGDYLGAVTCITEVTLLASILSRQKTFDLFSNLYHHMTIPYDGQNISDLTLSLCEDSKTVSLLRFLAVAIALPLWSWIMDPPKVSKSDLSTKDSAEPKTRKVSPEKAKAQAVVSSPKSTFHDKYDACLNYLDALAKPVGSLGTLEEWAARLCALQGSLEPQADPVGCIIFAGDHGVAKSIDDGGESCSLYPQPVTRAILAGLQHGVAGASVLANEASLAVVDVGVAGDPFDGPVVISSPNKVVGGTKSFCTDDALTAEESDRCILAGRKSLAEMVEKKGCKIIALGEVGVGNTTSASAIIAALSGEPVENVCGGGAFASRTADESAIKKKVDIVSRALKRHKDTLKESAIVLSKLGGAEIAALVGALLEASDRSIPVLVDGFIVSVAALVAVGVKPSVCNVLFFSTRSAEKGQLVAVHQIQQMAKKCNLPTPTDPILSMGLRMGEGTGALLATPILQSAATMVANMATIQEILSS